ncbi:MAG: hypothetical protein MJE77_29625 [Proteobacteria bacterium]|nr:hypothetical protein [Pseudomonadota bacterium]
MTFARFVSALFVIASVLLLAGCQEAVLCGLGTIERNGVCEPAENSANSSVACGLGTYFDHGSQTCVSNHIPMACDPGSTIPVVDSATGVTTCVGAGGAVNCATPLICPTPAADKVSVCGRIVDVASGQPVETDGVRTNACQDASTGGPCALGLAFFDVATFIADPDTAQPAAVESLHIDECGRFRASNVDLPDSPFLGIGIDDRDPSPDRHVRSGVAFAVAPGQTLERVRVYAVDRDTDRAWTTSAGNPAVLGGKTFGDKGVYLALFRDRGRPVAGVRITSGEPLTETDPANTFYFSSADGTDQIRTVAASSQATGANGAGLLLNSPLKNHSGSGGERANCSWPVVQGASISGAVFVQEQHMIASHSRQKRVCP